MTIAFQQKNKRSLVRVFYLLITFSILFFNFNREIINVSDGVGWDGKKYLKITEDISSLGERTINQYYVQRILVPVIVNRILWITSSARTLPDIIFAYRIFNLTCLLIAILFYLKIVSHLALSIKNEIIGFCCLFWTFPVLKLSSYYPMLTDIAAFALGIILVYYYLRDQLVGMLSIIFLGCFVYPTFSLFLLLIFFKKRELIIESTKHNLQRFILPAAFAAIVLLLYLLYRGSFVTTISFSAPINEPLFVLSLIVGTLYLYAISFLLPSIKAWFTAFKFLHIRNLWFGMSFFLVIYFLRIVLASPQKTGFTLKQFLLNVTKQSITNPGISIIAHTAYFGLFIVLIAIFRLHMKHLVWRYGFGLLALVMIISILSIGNESRQLINFYPLIVVLCIMAIQHSKKKIHNLALGFYLFISLGISSFWEKLSCNGEMSTVFLMYPAQKYFRYQGPWMSNASYYLFIGIFVVIVSVFFLLHNSNKLFCKECQTQVILYNKVVL